MANRKNSFQCVLLLSWLLCAVGARAAEPSKKSGLDKAYFDTSVKPGDDFFQYANGKWIKSTQIPAEYSAWGVDEELHEQTMLELRGIVESLSQGPSSSDANRQKIRDFYRTAMDEAKLQRDGAAPLREELEQIAALRDLEGLVALLAHLQTVDVEPVFSFSVDQDEKASSQY